MHWLDVFYIGAAISFGIILWTVVADEKARNVMLGILAALTLGYFGRAWWRGEDEPDDKPALKPPPKPDYGKTDEKIADTSASLDDADADAHDGSSSNVSDALDILEDYDANR